MTTDIHALRRDVAELLEYHSSGRNVADFTRYADDPVGFMRDELDFRPYPKQVEIIEAVLQNKRTVVRGCHGSGKDATLAALALWACYCRGMLVLVLSATERQLLNQTWREVRRRFSERLPGELYARELRIGGERRIVAMTAGADSVSHLTGWHDSGGVFICISESQAESVGDASFDAAETNAIDERSKILVVGNPVEPSGRFHDVHSRKTWAQVRMSAFDHPNIIERREVVPGGPSHTWPEEMAAEYGVNSPFYQARVLAEFPVESSSSVLVRRAHLTAAVERWRDAGLAEIAVLRGPTVLGVDVARFGADSSCVAVCHGARVHELRLWGQEPTDETARRVISIANEYQASFGRFRRDIGITVDDVGVGGGVTDQLRAAGVAAAAFNSSAEALDPRHLNLRASAYWHFRTQLERGEVALPDDAALFDEAAALEYQLNSSGKIQIESKKEFRRRLRRSPDRLDACVMGLLGASTANQRTGFYAVQIG